MQPNDKDGVQGLPDFLKWPALEPPTKFNQKQLLCTGAAMELFIPMTLWERRNSLSLPPAIPHIPVQGCSKMNGFKSKVPRKLQGKPFDLNISPSLRATTSLNVLLLAKG